MVSHLTPILAPDPNLSSSFTSLWKLAVCARPPNMKNLWQDVSYGVRMLLKKPGFTAAAALSLALGIGANTAIFGLINAILMGSLPYRQPDRLVMISTVPPQKPEDTQGVSVPDYMAWKSQNRSFDVMGAMSGNIHDFGAQENGSAAERIQGEDFTPELFQALGVQPRMGRIFNASEDQVDAPAPVI